MGSNKRNTPHRSRIIDNFLSKFKKVVTTGSATEEVPEPEATAIVVPPSALRSAALASTSSSTAYLSSQNLRRSSAASSTRSDAVSISSARSAASISSEHSGVGSSVGSTHSETVNIQPSTEAVTIQQSVASTSVDSGSCQPTPSCSSAGSTSSASANATNQSVPNVCPERRCANDFRFGKILGEGSFSVVYQCKEIRTGREFAIKACRKSFIMKEKKVAYIKRERDILALLSNRCKETAPFFVKIHSSFQEPSWLFFVLSCAKGGELFDHIHRAGNFSVECTRFYAGEILLALEHMHSLGVIHRDLKPENILFDENMHIQISDFGCAKFLEKPEPEAAEEEGESSDRRYSFVGTAQYVPPELLGGKGARDRAVDLWAFGAVIYQMAAGRPPFRSSSEYLVFQKIKSLDYEFPEGFSPEIRDLVERLLVKEPNGRLGATDGDTYTSIRAHKFFDGVAFEELYKTAPPPIYPTGGCPTDLVDLDYTVSDDVSPGFDDKQISRLLGLDIRTSPPPQPKSKSNEPTERRRRSLLRLNSLTPSEMERRLGEQRVNDPRWHSICNGNLILKKGIVLKKKGLFPRRRMLLLTTGPHLYYADPDTMMCKGQIPWSAQLREEASNFKNFYVHTPSRSYVLHDPEGYALEWCKAIEELRVHTYERSS